MNRPFTPTYHRDHTVTIWDVHVQQWARVDAESLTDAQSASLDAHTLLRVRRHLGLAPVAV